MRKILLSITPIILLGCSSEPADEAPAEEPAAVETEAVMVTANGSSPGSYDVTAADGTVTRSVLNADGTYVDSAADGSTLDEGTWAVTDGKTCFTSSGESGETNCYTEASPGEDGSFVATPDEGDPVTVKPSAEEEAPAA